MYIAIDFDGTIVDHRYPDVGAPVPGAIEAMKALERAGHKLILWTMRDGPTLRDAVKYCEDAGIIFYGVNSNPSQATWTQSPKVYAHVYIDDAALGCPLRENPRYQGRAFVDWELVMVFIANYDTKTKR